ncbi:hypothetical protein NDU88_004493 [Pleurodeles waltl]|uniref:Uncharacterized protein n=1 Tax=Pleurodeles waltl TaxID=8319 RepID=A0AAV7QC50_PLEWA|nr:hypothetical protein NDU88_004493 [Pleurodeles waltl]
MQEVHLRARVQGDRPRAPIRLQLHPAISFSGVRFAAKSVWSFPHTSKRTPSGLNFQPRVRRRTSSTCGGRLSCTATRPRSELRNLKPTAPNVLSSKGKAFRCTPGKEPATPCRSPAVRFRCSGGPRIGATRPRKSATRPWA